MSTRKNPLVYVASVKTNVKSAEPITFDLTPKTLIIGGNGEGKTSRLNGVQLAIDGAAYDVAGRARVAAGADVLALLSAPGSDSVFAEATWSNGQVSTYRVERKPDGTSTRPKHEGGNPTALLASSVRVALAGSVETARSFFAHHLLHGVSRDDVLRALSDRFQGRYVAACALTPDTDEMSRLTGCIATLTAAAKKNAKDAKAILASVDGTASGIGPCPTDAMLSEAEESANTAAVARDTAIGAGSRRPTAAEIEAAEAQAESLLQDARTTAAALVRIEATIAELDAKVVDMKGLGELRALRQIAAMHADSGAALCAVCGSAPLAPFAATVERLDAILARFAEAERAAEALRVASAQRATLYYPRALSAAQAAQTARGMVTRMRADAAVTDAIVNRSEIDERATRAASYLAELRRVRAQYDVLREQRNVAANLSDLAESHAELAAELVRARDGLLDSTRAAFEARVNKYLPADMPFRLVLRDGGREVCRFGFVDSLAHDGITVLSAPSGGEWEALILAVASALGGDGPTVLIPEERAYDPATLRLIMSALADSPAQIILTSTVKPSGKLPAGWSLIDLTQP